MDAIKRNKKVEWSRGLCEGLTGRLEMTRKDDLSMNEIIGKAGHGPPITRIN